MHAREVLRLLEHGESDALEALLERQLQKGRDVALFLVDRLFESLAREEKHVKRG